MKAEPTKDEKTGSTPESPISPLETAIAEFKQHIKWHDTDIGLIMDSDSVEQAARNLFHKRDNEIKEQNRTINEQNMSIQQLKDNFKGLQKINSQCSEWSFKKSLEIEKLEQQFKDLEQKMASAIKKELEETVISGNIITQYEWDKFWKKHLEAK